MNPNIVEVEINGTTTRLSDRIEAWISDEIRKQRGARIPLSINVRIGGDLDLMFSATESPKPSRPHPRKYTIRQKQIIDLWCDHNLNSLPISPSDLIAFLRKLKNYIH